MTKPKRKTHKIKWKSFGFVPNGWDDSQMIKYGDKGFLFLCNELRNDYRKLAGFTVKDRKWRPGQGGCNCTYDWTGLQEAIYKPGAKTGPPNLSPRVLPRTLGNEEREGLGRTAHQNWQAVRLQQQKEGQAVPAADLRDWTELSNDEREFFRRSGESLAVPEYMMWDWLAGWRKLVGEKAFRKKMLELSVGVAFERWNRDWTEAERYKATDIIVKLSEMLEVPSTPG